MDLIKKERERFEELSKEAMMSLSVKDDIINDMKIQLDKEHQENTNLRLKVNELESKLIMIDENLDIDDGEKLKNSLNSKKSSIFNRNFFKNLNNSVEVKQETYDCNMRNLIEESKILFEENNVLRDKIKEIENENHNLLAKSQKLHELDDINKQKIEAQRIKIEQLEIYLNQSKDRENYIDELINRYKSVENEFENVVISKDSEILNLNNKIIILSENIDSLTNQINFLSQNSNSMTQDLVKQIRTLEEKNKELEMTLYKSEYIYQEEIKLLQKSLHESDNNNKNNKDKHISESCHLPQGNNKIPSDMKVEDLANSLSKPIRNKVESLNKKIASQSVEVISLKYEYERIASELTHEKEVNQKLQHSLADQKYKVSNQVNKRVETEESAVQTNLRLGDLEQDRRKIKALEHENNDLNDKLFEKDKQKTNLNEKIAQFENENTKLCGELNLLIRKNEKDKKSNKFQNFDHDLLYNLSTISKLNATISQMKQRENELLDAIQSYENNQQYLNNNHEKSVIPSNPVSAKSNNNFNSTRPLQQTKFFNSGLNSNNMSQRNQKEESNILISFNLSEESIERERNNNVKSNKNAVKHTNIDIDLKRITEDNIYLKEQNFRYISELQRLQDNINFFQLQLTNKDQEIDAILKEKSILSENLNNHKLELEKVKSGNSLIIDEFKSKLFGFNEMNNRLSEQFMQLQNKFQLQNDYINEKNSENNTMQERLKILIHDKDDLLFILKETEDKILKIDKENQMLKSKLDSLISQKADMSNYIDNTLNNNNSQITLLEDKLNSVITDNSKLSDINNKLKAKLKEMIEQLKLKDDKLRETHKENEEIFKKELMEIRKESDIQLQKNQEIKLENNDLKYEIKLLKDKLHYGSNLVDSKSYGNDKMESSFDCSVVTNVPSVKKHKRNLSKVNNVTCDEYYAIKEENFKINVEVEDLRNKLYEKDNAKRDLNDKINLFEIEKQRFEESSKKNQAEIDSLKKEIAMMKNNSDHLTNIQKLLGDIKEKNQTINYLLDENDKLKREVQILKDNSEQFLKNKVSDSEALNARYKKLEDEYTKYKEKVGTELTNLNNSKELYLQENLKLKKDCDEFRNDKIELTLTLDEKIQQYEKLIKDLQNQITDVIKERDDISNETKEMLIKHCKEYEALSEKITKNKQKFEKIIQIYENHLNYLQQRYKINISDLLNALNLKNSGKDFNFEKILKNLDNTSLMINDISQREAAIESYKNETRKLRNEIKSLSSNLKKTIKENDDLKEQLNIKSLQKKLNPSAAKENEHDIIKKLSDFTEILQENSASRLEEQRLIILLKKKDNELRLVKLKIENNDKEKIETENIIISKDNEIKQKESHITELNKNYKNDIFKATEEISHIKEKWVTPEKWLETVTQITNLEKTIKTQKEDINRKKELIEHLKKSSDNPSNKTNSASNNDNEITLLNEKIKSLNKELIRSQSYIKDLKSSNETLKNLEKKNQEELTNLNEKLKILKIDISRKEEILKNTKDKLNVINDEQMNKAKGIGTLNEDPLEKIKKLKLDLDRKDINIKTLKAKLDTSTFEIEQLKSQNMRLSKSSINEVDKELKLHEMVKTKADTYLNYSENLLSVLKRIFKDIVTHYESLKVKYTSEKFDVYNRFKESLEILNMRQNYSDEFISPEKNIDIFEKIMKMLDNSSYFDVSQIVEIFFNLKEKIISFYRSNPNISENLNTFTTGDNKQNPMGKYENLLSKIKDNSKNKQVVNDMENLMKNLKYLNDSSN